MSPIAILLNDTQAPQPGESLRGTVVVAPQIHRLRNGIRLRLRWYTKGKGFRNCGTVVELEPEWVPDNFEAGQYRYPFCLRLPYGPFSYEGEMFSVYWELEASPKTWWPFPTTARKPLVLHPIANMRRWEGLQCKPLNPVQMCFGSMAVQGSGNGELNSVEPGLRLQDDAGHGGVFCFGLLALVVSLYISIVFIAIGWSFAAVVCLPFLLMGGLACLPGLEMLLARCLLRGIELDVTPRAQRGQVVHCDVRFVPRFGMHLQQVNVALNAQERCRYRKRSRSRTKHSIMIAMHNLWFQTRSENQAMGLTAGKVVMSHACFRLPADAPLTFLARDNQVVWQVTVTIQLKGLPSWSRSLMVEVGPG